MENALRNNGFTQQSYQLNAGTAAGNAALLAFPNLPCALPLVPSTCAVLGGATLQQQNIYQIDRAFHAPYMMQSNIGVERALPGRTSLSVNLIDSRGVHTQITRDINAPFTFGPNIGAIPYPGFGPIYQYESAGLYKQIQYITNVSTRFNRRVSLSGYYALGFAHSNANGLPMDQYNLAEDLRPGSVRRSPSRIYRRRDQFAVRDQCGALYHDEFGFSFRYHNRRPI